MSAVTKNGTVYAESRARVAGRVEGLAAHLRGLEERMDVCTSKEEFVVLLTSYRLAVRDGLEVIGGAIVEER